MADELLPLFPLRLVALPQTRIPLHIFEDRYKEMVGKVLESGSEFGIVLAQQEGIVNIGCAVTVVEVLERYEDGRMDILCLGSRRFEIVLVNEEKDYLRASVQFFDDDDANSTAALRLQALSAWEQAKPLLPEMTEEKPDLSKPLLSFQLAESIPDMNARQLLLQLRSEEERLKQIIAFFSGFAARQARVQHVRRVAPTNGHGHMDKEISAEET